jgi:hypothetical protein
MQRITLEQYQAYGDDYAGFCVECGTFADDGIEPDAREYECDVCGERKVFGLQELLIMGLVD